MQVWDVVRLAEESAKMGKVPFSAGIVDYLLTTENTRTI